MANLTLEEILRGIIDGSIEEIESGTLKSVYNHRLRSESNLKNLKKVDFPNCATIGEYGFYYSQNLEQGDFPKVTSIANNAFENDTKFKGAFESLTSGITGKTNVFHATGYETLDSNNFPNLTNVYQQVFREMPNLKRIHLPKLTSSGHNNYGYTFHNDPLLKTAVFEASSYSMLGGGSFNACSSMTAYDGSPVAINNADFDNTALDTLVLRRSSIVNLTNVSAFNGTKFGSSSTGGIVYVPSNLISSYESATNWSTLLGYDNNQILPIEGSQYEHYYVDGVAVK